MALVVPRHSLQVCIDARSPCWGKAKQRESGPDLPSTQQERMMGRFAQQLHGLRWVAHIEPRLKGPLLQVVLVVARRERASL